MVENATDDLLSHAAGALVDVVSLHVWRQKVDFGHYFCARTFGVGAKDLVIASNAIGEGSTVVLRLGCGDAPNKGSQIGWLVRRLLCRTDLRPHERNHQGCRNADVLGGPIQSHHGTELQLSR